MKKDITLDEIIKEVLREKGREYDQSNDSNAVALRRAFFRLIERLGSDKEVFKVNGKYLFNETEIPFMKSLLIQLYGNTGVIADFVNKGKKNKKFSSKEVREFLDTLNQEAEKAESELEKADLIDMGMFFSNLFLWSPLRSVEECHGLIDARAAYLPDLPVDQQSFFLGKVEQILKKEFALRIVEATMRIAEIAGDIEISKKLGNDDIGIQDYYYESDPQIRFHYIQRDKRVLEAIQEDDDLRQYIEKKFGKRAEEIFNYAILDM